MKRKKNGCESGEKNRGGKVVRWLEDNSKTAGILAALFILAFYFGVITAFNSFGHALGQFSADWPWIAALSLGFGLQVRLHLLLKMQLRKMAEASGAGMAASAGVSGTAMVACCAHHVSDALPFLGLAGAAGFLFDYREVFLLLGVLSNFVGIAYLLNKFNELGVDSGMPGKLQKLFSAKDSVKVSLVGSAAVFLSYVLRVFVAR